MTEFIVGVSGWSDGGGLGPRAHFRPILTRIQVMIMRRRSGRSCGAVGLLLRVKAYGPCSASTVDRPKIPFGLNTFQILRLLRPSAQAIVVITDLSECERPCPGSPEFRPTICLPERQLWYSGLFFLRARPTGRHLPSRIPRL